MTELQKLIEKNVVCLCDVLRGNMICRRHQLIKEIQAWAKKRAISYCNNCGDVKEALSVPLEEFGKEAEV